MSDNSLKSQKQDYSQGGFLVPEHIANIIIDPDYMGSITAILDYEPAIGDTIEWNAFELPILCKVTGVTYIGMPIMGGKSWLVSADMLKSLQQVRKEQGNNEADRP